VHRLALCSALAAPASEADLAGAQGRGEAVDIGALFDAHALFLVRVVERLTGSGSLAEDLVQEVFVVAHRRRAELHDGDDVRGWLYRVALNQVRHHRRASGRRLSLLSRFARDAEVVREVPSAPGADRERAELAARVRRCIARLPLAQREVLVLYELEELPGAAVAELLGVPENTIWTRLHRARERFRKLWRTSERGGSR
jgi:RNA polymerase sigma-70 factor (ECF subfamily)